MTDDIMNFSLPEERSSVIKVIGIGGGGCNAVNHMFEKGIKDVNFIVCNTDHQALAKSKVPLKVEIGQSVTEGRGAGNKPEIGRQAALENMEDIMESLSGNTRMVILTAGMGGGTGTGATPVIAEACKDKGLLTVAVVTIPFNSEGKTRVKCAVDGINELKDHVDSLLVINNESLREICGNQSVSTAFANIDDVLTTAVKGIAETLTVPGYINVDFADVESVMKDPGVALMGMGSASGHGRALKAVENALASPLMNSNEISEAKSILINISSGSGANELTMDEMGEITDYMYEAAAEDAVIIRGMTKDENLNDKINITVIATGYPESSIFKPKEHTKSKTNVDSRLASNASIGKEDDAFKAHDKKSKPIIFDFDQDIQGDIDFNIEKGEDLIEIMKGNPYAGDERVEKLERIEHIPKKKGHTGKIPNDFMDTFENVPAFIRKNIPVGLKKNESDKVHFSASFPPFVKHNQKLIIDVWAYLYRDRNEVINLINQTKLPDEPVIIRPGTPLYDVKRGTALTISLTINDITGTVDKSLVWDGEIVNTSFIVDVPSNIPVGDKFGSITIHCPGGLQVAKIELKIRVTFAASPTKNVFQDSLIIQNAFASYSSADRDEVLARIQGMQKVRPDLNVFLDVLTLRSGQDWENELWRLIPQNDVFYLFWSSAAKESTWVEKEWRCALQSRGMSFIDPVPLVSPEVVPPPAELSNIHFNDWTLAFKRGKSIEDK